MKTVKVFELRDYIQTWRDEQGLTNAEAAVALSAIIGYQVSTRTLEGWVQGRKPHYAVEMLIKTKLIRRIR